MLLKGKTAVVTGGGRGLGKAIALEFANQGANVAILGRNKENLDITAGEIKKIGSKGFPFPCNLREQKRIKAASKAILKKFEKIDFLVNNAAVSFRKPFVEHSDEEINETIDLNYKGAVFMTKAFLPGMLEQKTGTIINISSFGGTFSEAMLSVYCGSKAALNLFTKSIAKELNGSGVNVYLVNLGSVDTETFRQHYPNFNPAFVQKSGGVAEEIVKLCLPGSEAKNGFSLDLIKLGPLWIPWKMRQIIIRMALG